MYLQQQDGRAGRAEHAAADGHLSPVDWLRALPGHQQGDDVYASVAYVYEARGRVTYTGQQLQQQQRRRRCVCTARLRTPCIVETKLQQLLVASHFLSALS